MAQDVTVDKSKFDSLPGKMLATPPLSKADVKVAKPKPKQHKSSPA
ncbi:MAG: hypothetical protein ABSF93_00395 [Candidatus Sulfotelmatobacter sp.]|jgi:hypothetical protein